MLFALLLAAAPACAVAPVEVLALFKDRAVVRGSADQHMLREGETSPDGITLLEADARGARVRYRGEVYDLDLSRHVSGSFAEAERQRVAISPDPLGQYRVRGAINDTFVDFLVDNRTINGTATMLIDVDRCTACDDCVRACAATHGNNPRFRRHGPSHENLQVTNACMHCADPVCLIGCPTGAIHRHPSGPVVIDLSELEALDTGGAWAITRLAARLEAEGVAVSLRGASEAQRALLETVARSQPEAEAAAPPRRGPLAWLEALGRRTAAGAGGFVEILGFLGQVMACLGRTLLRPGRHDIGVTGQHEKRRARTAA